MSIMDYTPYWEHLMERIEPIPRAIVESTSYDEHTPLRHREPASLPWAGSGHYGKELNLMLSGLKRVALLQGGREIDHWRDAIEKHRWVVHTESHGSIYVAWPDAADLIALDSPVVTMEDGGVAIGLALGYQPNDVAAHMRHVADLIEEGGVWISEPAAPPPT